MRFELAAEELPPQAKQGLLGLAQMADFLLIGELHGTQEVPRIVAGLLPLLHGLGYGGLALEVPYVEREALARWAASLAPAPPEFFANPTADGRGNIQVLALVERAAASSWQVLCFDQGPDQMMQQWSDRDSFMADNLARQWEALCPGRKVLGICGNLHARLTEVPRQDNDPQGERWWPSFASWFQQRQPAKVVQSVAVIFHEGEIYNMGIRQVHQRSLLSSPELCSPSGSGCGLDLHLPRASAATFLRQPYDWRTA